MNRVKRLKGVITERRQRLDAFDEIVIEHPRFDDIAKRTLLLIEDTEARMKQNERKKIAAGKRSFKRKELWVLPIIGPSGSTKSTSMEHIVDEIGSLPGLGDDDVPIQIVTLDENTRNTKQLQVQILEAFEDPGAETLAATVQYNADRVNDKIRKIAENKRTRVLVLDEAGNMLAHAGLQVAKQMAKAIKGLVNKGIFSVILMGTDEVQTLFNVDKELQSRNCGTIDLNRFDIKWAPDRKYFFTFVADFEKRLVKDKIIDRPIDLVGTVEGRAMVYDFANGIIGLVPRILRIAVDRTLTAGRGHVEWEDIASAFHVWNLSLDKKDRHYDPFGESGPNKETLRFIREDSKPGRQQAA